MQMAATLFMNTENISDAYIFLYQKRLNGFVTKAWNRRNYAQIGTYTNHTLGTQYKPGSNGGNSKKDIVF